MKLCGVTSIDQLHPGYLNTLEAESLIPGSRASLLSRQTKSRI